MRGGALHVYDPHGPAEPYRQTGHTPRGLGQSRINVCASQLQWYAGTRGLYVMVGEVLADSVQANSIPKIVKYI